jgi:hypothetical protein
MLIVIIRGSKMKKLIFLIFIGSIILPQSQVSKQPVSHEIIPIVIPTVECLNLNYSYPFNPKYILTLDLSRETNVKISIFDKNEGLIRVLVNQVMPVGHSSVFWDRKDYKGDLVIDDVDIHICKLEK